jgi:hypothetical protein
MAFDCIWGLVDDFTSSDGSGPTGSGGCMNTQGRRHLSGLIFRAFLRSSGPSVGMFQRGGYSPKAHDCSFYLRVGPVLGDAWKACLPPAPKGMNVPLLMLCSMTVWFRGIGPFSAASCTDGKPCSSLTAVDSSSDTVVDPDKSPGRNLENQAARLGRAPEPSLGRSARPKTQPLQTRAQELGP